MIQQVDIHRYDQVGHAGLLGRVAAQNSAFIAEYLHHNGQIAIAYLSCLHAELSDSDAQQAVATFLTRLSGVFLPVSVEEVQRPVRAWTVTTDGLVKGAHATTADSAHSPGASPG